MKTAEKYLDLCIFFVTALFVFPPKAALGLFWFPPSSQLRRHTCVISLLYNIYLVAYSHTNVDENLWPTSPLSSPGARKLPRVNAQRYRPATESWHDARHPQTGIWGQITGPKNNHSITNFLIKDMAIIVMLLKTITTVIIVIVIIHCNVL